jgi:beta-phosphoglucomutase-like phosphatase (HAD superfamily)
MPGAIQTVELLDSLGVPMSVCHSSSSSFFSSSLRRTTMILIAGRILSSYSHNQVATNAFKSSFDIKSSRHDQLFNRFKHIVTGDNPSITHGKPHPDIYLHTAKLMGINPEEHSRVVVIEDSVFGVEVRPA